MAAQALTARVGAETFRREEVLPFPAARGVRVFAFQRVGEGDAAPARVLLVAQVEAVDFLDLYFEVRLEGFRQQGDAIFVALAAAHEDVVIGEIDVLDAKAEGFGEAQPTAVEQLGHQPGGAVEEGHQAAYFFLREDGGQALGALGEGEVQGWGEFPLEDVAVEEEKGAEGLVLGRSGDVLVGGEVGEEGFNFRCAHLSRVAFVVEEDEPADPLDVGLFGAVGVVACAEGGAYAIEQLRLLGGVRHGVASLTF